MDSRQIGLSLPYDLLLAFLYAWSVFQAYAYDAKTQTTGILIYVLVYGVFTILIRSFAGIVMMNLLSAVTFPLFFTAPAIHHAGSYFAFQPFFGMVATLLIGLIQCLFLVPFTIFAKRFLATKSQYISSGVIAIFFTIILTIFVFTIPDNPSVATVTADGTVTAFAPGVAHISATDAKGYTPNVPFTLTVK